MSVAHRNERCFELGVARLRVGQLRLERGVLFRSVRERRFQLGYLSRARVELGYHRVRAAERVYPVFCGRIRLIHVLVVLVVAARYEHHAPEYVQYKRRNRRNRGKYKYDKQHYLPPIFQKRDRFAGLRRYACRHRITDNEPERREKNRDTASAADYPERDFSRF